MTVNEQVARILADWQESRDRGQAPAPEDVISAHPEIADALRSHFAFLGLLEMKAPSAGGEIAGPPERVGDFRILREIGRGGMGVVYEAEQVSLGRRVALKVLSLTFASAPNALKRFEREARAAGSLHHTNLVPIFAMGVHEGHWYYAMELVEGRSLDHVVESLRRGSPDRTARSFSTVAESSGTRRQAGYSRVAEAFAGVAEALHTAHEAGVVHRDVKPSNLLLDGSGVLKIVDFGLAYQAEEGRPSLTMTGDMLGTPAYMSPEQAKAGKERVDHRTDVYSLGATLYEVLTLRPPFEGRSIGELYEAILRREPAPLRRHVAHVPRDLETVVLKALEKDPAKRYASASDLARDLRRFAAGTGVAARPVGALTRTWRRARRHKVRTALVLVVAGLVVAGTVLAFSARRADRERREMAYDRLLVRGARSVGFFATPKNSHTTRPVENARALYRDAVELLPERPEAHWLLGVLGGASTEERLEHLESARDRGLPARAWHLARAHVLSQAKRWDEVQQERDLGAESESTGTVDAFLEAMLLQREGNREEALKLLGRAVDQPGPSAIRTMALAKRAELRLEQRDAPGAIDDFSRAIETQPDAVDLRVKLAAAWRRQGVDDAAEDRFDDALAWARAHDLPEVWGPIAQACFALREQQWMLRATEEAESRHPSDPRVLALRAFALGWSGRTVDCIEIARRLVEADPDYHAGYEVLGRALTDLEELEEARDVLERACALDERCPRSLQALAWVRLKQGEATEAVELYDHVVTLAPRFLDAHVQYGDALLAVGDAAGALARYEHVLGLHPTHADAFLGCGQAHEALREPEKACVAYEKVRELQPPRVDAALHLWRLQDVQGWKDERTADLERTAREHAEDEGFLHLRGHALRLLGRDDEADDCLARSEERCEACRDEPASVGVQR